MEIEVECLASMKEVELNDASHHSSMQLSICQWMLLTLVECEAQKNFANRLAYQERQSLVMFAIIMTQLNLIRLSFSQISTVLNL